MQKELSNKASREDFRSFATKEDLRSFATKEDLRDFATKQDLKTFATKDDLKIFATKTDLKNFPTKDDLRDSLKQFATKDHLFAIKQDMDLRFSAVDDSLMTLKEFALATNFRLDKIEKRLDTEIRHGFNQILDFQDQLVTFIKERDKMEVLRIGKSDRHESVLADHEKRLRIVERN